MVRLTGLSFEAGVSTTVDCYLTLSPTHKFLMIVKFPSHQPLAADVINGLLASWRLHPDASRKSR